MLRYFAEIITLAFAFFSSLLQKALSEQLCSHFVHTFPKSGAKIAENREELGFTILKGAAKMFGLTYMMRYKSNTLPVEPKKVSMLRPSLFAGKNHNRTEKSGRRKQTVIG